MRKIKLLILAVLEFTAGTLWAQHIDPAISGTPLDGAYATPTPTVLKKWNFSSIPWDAWFNKNTEVADNTDYVYFFWNAQDFNSNFEVKDKKRRLAEAALQMAFRLYPAGSKADAVKVDIGYVRKRDSYNNPELDTLQKAAHFEFLRTKVLKFAAGKKEPSLGDLQKNFDQFIIH